MICDNLTVSNGRLLFAGQDTVELARQYGTPLYLMDEDRIRANCRVYTEAFRRHFGPGARPLYASKANSFQRIYEIMREEGMGIDVVSSGEIYTALRAGYDLGQAYFHSNNKTDEDIRYSMDHGIGYFVADNVEEIKAIEAEAARRGIKQRVLLRLTPGIDPHTYEAIATGKVDSKFGSAIETGQAEEITLFTLRQPHVELVGFHCHVGSQVFAEDVFERAAVIMLEFAAHMEKAHGYQTRQLDLGGGYGVRYVECDPVLDVDAKVAQVLIEDERLSADQADRLVAKARQRAEKQTDRETYQAMEGFVHNLNTMHSRAGAQTPFSSINYGTDTSPEGRMAIRNVLLAEDAGLGHGETPIFPIHIFKVKEGVNYNESDPNYDLFQLSMKVSAKRLFPNYVFLDAPFNLQYYKPGHPETEVATMGCRTRVMGNVYDPTREISYSRGNLSFTSINLPRLAIESNHDEKLFYQKLDKMMELVAQQLLDRFEIQASKRVYNYPFLMGQGVWLDSEKLGPNDEVREVLKHGTLSIGFIGLAETLTALYGHHHGESDEMEKKGLEIIGHMRKFCDSKSQEMHMNFTLLGTPAEGLSGRFTRLDQKRYGKIPGVTDREYYTNSFHVPVWYNISAYDKIQKEAPFHALTNAGHISYVELDGDTANNLEAFESVVRCMHDAGIGYGSINHPVDRDPVCGYVGVIGDVCPRCGRRSGEPLSAEKLAELRRKYPSVPKFCGCE